MTYKTLWGSYYLTHLKPLSTPVFVLLFSKQSSLLLPGSPLPGPGSLQAQRLQSFSCHVPSHSPSVFACLDPSFLPSMAEILILRERFWTTQLVWPLHPSLYRMALIYVLCMILYFYSLFHINRIWAPRRTGSLIYLYLGHKKKKKKKGVSPDAFWECSVFHRHVHLVMRWKVLSISWQRS